MSGRRLSVASLVFAGVASLAVGCTLLVTFDDRGDAGCEGVSCRAPDAPGPTSAPDASDAFAFADAPFPGDAPGSIDGTDSSDAADAVADAALDVLIVAGDAGGCVGQMNGVLCGPASACATSTCQAGTCVASMQPDGAPCGSAKDACHGPRVCAAGVCGASPVANNGATCAAASNDCHPASKCSNGACVAGAAFANGTAWKSGDAEDICCSGDPVVANTSLNCGVCGWKCETGTSCKTIGDFFFCTGCTSDDECASGCCSLDPSPNHCSPSNCNGSCQANACTGGSHCVSGTESGMTIDYCKY